jgi:hypothetical protein
MKFPEKLLRSKGIRLLLVFSFLIRVFYLFDNAIPFSFDHGKDSLAIMDLVLNLSPKFIGPWTSIPGLYFGPAWYYLLAPFYLLFGFHPVGGAVAMLVLVLIQIFLAQKYFGKYEALIIATAPLWFILTKSAWNPYPMTVVSLGVLIVVTQAISAKFLTQKQAFLLGLISSFGFHFSAAFAIFYPVIILAALLLFRVRLSIKNALLAGAGFFVPFLPQLLFELRYNFSQVRAVLQYFQEGEDHAFSTEKILEVLRTTFGEIRLGILPETNYLGNFSTVVVVALVVGLVVLLWQKAATKEVRERFILAGLFTFIPVCGYFFLHFNVWYVYAIVPAIVLLVGSLLRHSPRWFRSGYVALLILGSIMMGIQYFAHEKADLLQSRGFLPIKIQTLDRIESIANGRSYASYHYVPDIYDFSYQYLYYWRGLHGHAMPTEFSYKPGEQSYLVQKAELSQRIPSPTELPEVIFFIVESPEQSDFLEQWWGQQRFGEITETIEMSPSLTLYVATP